MTTDMFMLGGRTRRRAFLMGLSGRGAIMLAVYIAVALVFVMITQSVWGLAALALGAVALYALLRVPSSVRSQPAVARAAGWLRHRQMPRRGWDAFTPSEDLPVPRPVGEILVLGVSPTPDAAEQVVVRHAPSAGTDAPGYFTTTVEIEGLGDGLWPDSRHLADTYAFGRMLRDLAGTPIHEVSISVHAVPGLPSDYRGQVQQMTRPDLAGTLMADNRDRLLDTLDLVSDQYRIFATFSIGESDLARTVARYGPADVDALCEGVLTVLGQAVERLDAAGLRVVGGMGPRRWAALVRHLYTPGWAIDDLSGIEDALDAFPGYPSALPEALRVPDPAHDVVWHHATAHVPADGWPAGRIGPRWVTPMVAEMFEDRSPSVIRTITATWRLSGREQSRDDVMDLLLGDATEVAAKAGRVTSGESEQQAGYNQQILADLRGEGSRLRAAGVRPSLRVTCSTPNMRQLYAARDLVDRSAAEMQIDNLEWMDQRQADAMVWSLPLGRGLARSWM